MRGICRMLAKWGGGERQRELFRGCYLYGTRSPPPLPPPEGETASPHSPSSFLLRFLFVSSPFPRDVPTLFFYLLCSLLFAGEYHELVKRRKEGRGEDLSRYVGRKLKRKPRAQTSGGPSSVRASEYSDESEGEASSGMIRVNKDKSNAALACAERTAKLNVRRPRLGFVTSSPISFFPLFFFFVGETRATTHSRGNERAENC